MELWKIVLGVTLSLLLVFVVLPLATCGALTCSGCVVGFGACTSAPLE